MMVPIAMSDTTAIAVVGILVSGVVGPGFAALWARGRQLRDHRHELGQKRYDDLAALLDAAAQTLAPGATRLRAGGAGDAEMIAFSSTVHVTYERLLLRLAADDPVVGAYRDARECLTEVGRQLGAGAGEEEVEGAVLDFEAARSEYLSCARECLAGAAGA